MQPIHAVIPHLMRDPLKIALFSYNTLLISGITLCMTSECFNTDNVDTDAAHTRSHPALDAGSPHKYRLTTTTTHI